MSDWVCLQLARSRGAAGRQQAALRGTHSRAWWHPSWLQQWQPAAHKPLCLRLLLPCGPCYRCAWRPLGRAHTHSCFQDRFLGATLQDRIVGATTCFSLVQPILLVFLEATGVCMYETALRSGALPATWRSIQGGPSVVGSERAHQQLAHLALRAVFELFWMQAEGLGGTLPKNAAPCTPQLCTAALHPILRLLCPPPQCAPPCCSACRPLRSRCCWASAPTNQLLGELLGVQSAALQTQGECLLLQPAVVARLRNQGFVSCWRRFDEARRLWNTMINRCR